MKRREVLIAAASLLAPLAGCQRGKKKMVAVIPKATSHIFWVAVQAGALAAGEEFGLEVLWNGPTLETDYTRQMQIVDSMIARHVDGIAIAAAERKALVQPVERAIAAGIPVTVFDSGLDSTDYMSYVATDNYAAGQLAARTLAQLLGGRGNIAVVLHAPGSQSTMDREQGFQDLVEKEYPKIHIVASQYGMASRAKAVAAAENILTAHPGLDGIFASTEPSSSGAALAIKARGLSGKIKFVSFDFSDSMIEDLKNGTIDAMVVQDPFRIGFEAVKTLADKLSGHTPPKRLDLKARVIRKEDLDKPEVKMLLSPDVKKYLK